MFYCGPAIDVGLHSTAIGVLCFAIDGAARLTFDGERREPLAATSVFTSAGLRHAISFDCERIACLYVDPTSDDAGFLTRGMRPHPSGALSDYPGEDKVRGIVESLAAGAVQAREVKLRLSAAFELPAPSGADPRIARSIGRLRSRPGDPNPLSELASEAGLSPSRFRHLFKAATGVSVKRYRLWTRIGAAMKSARAGATLTSAAHEAGFASSAHFASAYRDMFGFAPSVLLKRV